MHELLPIVQLDGQRLGRNMIRKLVTGKPGEEICGKTSQNGLTECLIYCHGVPHCIASDQRTRFTENEPMLTKFTGLTIFPPSSKKLT